MSDIGIERRLARIFDPNAVIYPLDDVLITGPHSGLRDLGSRYQEASDCGVDAILDYPGRLGDRNYQNVLRGMGRIVQLSASLSRGDSYPGEDHHLEKVVVGRVKQAVKIDAEAVSFHFNARSATEPHMLEDLGRVVEDCEEFGMPLMVHTYARVRLPGGREYHFDDLPSSEYSRIVAHAVAAVRSYSPHIVIKVPYTGEAFGQVVEAADGVPVVMAGGPKVSMTTFLSNSIAAMRAGARGIAGGRNAFERPPEEAQTPLNLMDFGPVRTSTSDITISNPRAYYQLPDTSVTTLLGLRAIVHHGAETVFDALDAAHTQYVVSPVLRQYVPLPTR